MLATTLVVLTLLSTIVILRMSGEHRAHGGNRRHRQRHKTITHRTAAIPTPLDYDEDGGIEVREHDSAQDAAEVLLNVSHTHGAVEVLSRFIEEHPKEAVTPWLRLLDTYRKAGAKEEYDTLAGRLNQHFNVHVQPWHQPSLPYSDPGLEAYPHVVDVLLRRWGTNDCHNYLGRLLADNRGGSRGGFSVETLDDILMLAGILEAVYISPADAAAALPTAPHSRTKILQRAG